MDVLPRAMFRLDEWQSGARLKTYLKLDMPSFPTQAKNTSSRQQWDDQIMSYDQGWVLCSSFPFLARDAFSSEKDSSPSL